MKHSGTTNIFIISCVAVLIGAYVVGLCIRQARFRNASLETEVTTESQVNVEKQRPGEADNKGTERVEMAQIQTDRGPSPGLEGEPPQPMGGGRDLMTMFQLLPPEQAVELRERWPDMSEEEREKIRAEMRDKFENMSEQEREQVMEKIREEREKFRAEIRERFGDRLPQGEEQDSRSGRGQRQSDEE